MSKNLVPVGTFPTSHKLLKSITEAKFAAPVLLVPRLKTVKVKDFNATIAKSLNVDTLPSFNLYQWNSIHSNFTRATAIVCYGVFETLTGFGTKVVSKQGESFVVHYLQITDTDMEIRFVML